jgi:hypothetical protein
VPGAVQLPLGAQLGVPGAVQLPLGAQLGVPGARGCCCPGRHVGVGGVRLCGGMCVMACDSMWQETRQRRASGAFIVPICSALSLRKLPPCDADEQAGCAMLLHHLLVSTAGSDASGSWHPGSAGHAVH